MMNLASLKRMLTVVGTVAVAAVGSGCTTGVVVDDNFNNLRNVPQRAAITFLSLDSGANYNFNLNGQAYVSFDDYAADGATTSRFPGLVNSAQYIPPGNYYVMYFDPQQGFFKSNNFTHSYDGSCTDLYNNNDDKLCEQYYFQVHDDNKGPCRICAGSNCGVQDLPTHNGNKVIELCR
jgi:hypothetical protein